MQTKPYYRRSEPKPFDFSHFPNKWIDLGGDPDPNRGGLRHLPPHANPLVDQRAEANSLFDSRTAAVVASIVTSEPLITIDDLLERNDYKGHAAHETYHLRPRALGVMAFTHFFPNDQLAFPNNPFVEIMRDLVSNAILKASPGWCGSFGPGVDGLFSIGASEGNYDMNQMHLLPLIYGYYDSLTENAQERLITMLLAQGRIHRPNENDTFTSGGVPNDWYSTRNR